MHVIRRLPVKKREAVTYYTTANGKAHWTHFRDLALSYSAKETSRMLALLNRGGLARKLEAVPPLPV